MTACAPVDPVVVGRDYSRPRPGQPWTIYTLYLETRSGVFEERVKMDVFRACSVGQRWDGDVCYWPWAADRSVLQLRSLPPPPRLSR